MKMLKTLEKFWKNKNIRNAFLGSVILILLAIIIFDEISLVFGGIALMIIGVILLFIINHKD